MHNKSRRRKKNRIDLQWEQAIVTKKNNQKGPETTHNGTKRSAITTNFPKIVGKDLQGPSATHSKPRQSTLTKEIINNDSKRSNIKSTMIPI